MTEQLVEQLSPDDKVLKALKLSRQGLTRQEIANILYPNPLSDKKSKLSGLRKLMERKGYVWDKNSNGYVVIAEIPQDSAVVQTNNNKHKQTATTKNVIKQTATNRKVSKQTASLPIEQPTQGIFTEGDRVLLEELVKLLRTQSEASQGGPGGEEAVSTIETISELSQLKFTDFGGFLQGTTLQLYSEVWEALEAFHKKHRVSKKVIVNEAIWDFLKKWRDI